MTTIWLNYIPVLFLILVSIVLIIILFLVSALLGSSGNTVDFEKFSTYECGFEPFSDTNSTFDVKFYLLAMLFLIFDLEVMFLLPWILSLQKLTFISLLICMWFFFVLIISFVYEWLKGALDWQ